MAFLCAEIPQGETWANAKLAGFDLGGYYHTSSNDGAISLMLGNRAANDAGGLTQTLTGGWKGAYTYWADLVTSSQYGRIARVLTVNGIGGTSYGKSCLLNRNSTPSGYITEERNNASTTTAVTWDVDQTEIAVNLGKNCSSGFGIYCFGVRNYSSAITESETERVAKYLAATGKIPHWWRSAT